eukprot:1149633-Pelagomonas_calceolata.AAC.4
MKTGAGGDEAVRCEAALQPRSQLPLCTCRHPSAPVQRRRSDCGAWAHVVGAGGTGKITNASPVGQDISQPPLNLPVVYPFAG